MVALVLVPLVAALVGVLGVSGFMYTPQLVGTVVVCLVVAAVTVPAGLLLGRRVAREAMWQREAAEAERRSEESRRRLVAGMSHDLRSPLAGICGMADALVDGVVRDPAEVRDYLGRIRREACRMTAMVEDLFQLSRATSGTLQLDPGAAGVGRGRLRRRRRGAAARRRRWCAEAPEAWPTVLGSDTDLTRVLRNVLANAVRHTPAGGTVRLSAGAQGGEAWLHVDDGCGGIPEADLPFLFDVGYRGSGARTPTEHSGAGLGLSIARGLMAAQGGGISLVNHGAGLPHRDHARRRGSRPRACSQRPDLTAATPAKARGPGRSATTVRPSGARQPRSAPRPPAPTGSPVGRTRPRCAPGPSPPVPRGARDRSPRAAFRPPRAAARPARSSRAGSPPIPTLPSASSTCPHRPSPGTRANTSRRSITTPRARHCACATGEWSTPKAGTPRRASPTSSRPGPQPRSTVGPVHRSSSQASSTSAGLAPAPHGQVGLIAVAVQQRRPASRPVRRRTPGHDQGSAVASIVMRRRPRAA